MSKRDQYKDPRGHHIRLYSDIFDSPAFKSLGPFDILAYLSLRRDLKLSNNGDLSLTLTKAKERGIKHHVTLARSLRALCAVGLICLTRKGGCSKGGQRLASLYGVTDQDIYEIPRKYIEARRASDAWKSVRSIEHGQQLIDQAEEQVKTESQKLKRPRHGMTGNTSADDVTETINRSPHDTWNDQPGHTVTYGENAGNPDPMRLVEHFFDAHEFPSHRTSGVPPIHTATPRCSGAVQSEPGNYMRMERPVGGRDWLPDGLVTRALVTGAVTKKAQKLLAKLPRGEHEAVVIQAGRSAGLSLDCLAEWSDAETVARALAANVDRPWKDLWLVQIAATS